MSVGVIARLARLIATASRAGGRLLTRAPKFARAIKTLSVGAKMSPKAINALWKSKGMAFKLTKLRTLPMRKGMAVMSRSSEWMIKAGAKASTRFPRLGKGLTEAGTKMASRSFQKSTLRFIGGLVAFEAASLGIDAIVDRLMEDNPELTREEAMLLVAAAQEMYGDTIYTWKLSDFTSCDVGYMTQVDHASKAISAFLFKNETSSLSYFNDNFSVGGKAFLISRLCALMKAIVDSDQQAKLLQLYSILSCHSDEPLPCPSIAFDQVSEEIGHNPGIQDAVEQSLLAIHAVIEGLKEEAFRNWIDTNDVFSDDPDKVDTHSDEYVSALHTLMALSLIARDPCGVHSKYVNHEENDEVNAEDIAFAHGAYSELMDTFRRLLKTGESHFFNQLFR